MNLQPEVEVEICSSSLHCFDCKNNTILFAKIQGHMNSLWLKKAGTSIQAMRVLPLISLRILSSPYKVFCLGKACQKETQLTYREMIFQAAGLKTETPTFCFLIGPSLIPVSHIMPFIQKGFKILQYTSIFKPSGLVSEVERGRSMVVCNKNWVLNI